MFRSISLRSCLTALTVSLSASVALATEAVLSAPNFPEEGVDYLRRASLVLQAVDSADSTPQDLVAAARADYATFVGVLYELGHYSGVISIRLDGREAANISPTETLSEIGRIAVTVDPGPAFRFSTATLQPQAPGTELPEGFATDQPAFSGLISDATQAGINGWRDVGHAKAGIAAQSITANHRRSQLAAEITLRPGPRLTFGDLVVDDPGSVHPHRIREIAGLPSGQVFSPAALEKAETRLRRTGTFRSVALNEADVTGPDDTLDIHAALIENKPRRIGFGAEISSLEGLMVSAFWLHRNLFGGAEKLKLDGEISGIGGDSGGIDYRFSARFDRPATITPDTSLFVEAQIEELDEPDFHERNAMLGVGLSHIFSDHLKGEIGVSYQYSEVRDTLGSRTLEHLLLPARLTFDKRDDPLNAHKGVYVDLEVTPFSELKSGSNGARLYLDARAYQSFGREDDYVLAARAQVGSVNGASLSEVPGDMLFYSGGAGSVRGQPYQSLAVDLGGGNSIGGRSFLAFSAELRAKLFGPWSVVGFADTGFVGQDSWGTRNGNWHSGAGLGARYDTGVGMIRVDVATPLDDDAGSDFELYIGIGQAF